ncbi:MAG TPA: GNAT family N-acetyltransferase [Candidatus Norongarragalinales archaeon]|nr:GNAT family N-acetyltransferase [Candidatus Norongarragalinales archaeon]
MAVMMEFTIRKAAFSDAEAILEEGLELTKFLKIYDPQIYGFKENYAGIYRNLIRKIMRGKKSAAFVAVYEGKIIGHILLVEKRHFPIYQKDSEAFVEEMFVAKQFRNLGVGTKLLDAAKKWGKTRKLPFLGINVHTKNNKAFKLYRNLGFREHHFEMRMKL